MSSDLKCPKCGDELEIRYEEFSEEILGLYCEDCQLIKYEDENDFQRLWKISVSFILIHPQAIQMYTCSD